MIRLFAIVGMLLLAPMAFAQNSPKSAPEFIGTATMSSGGVVTLHLTLTADGDHVDGTFTYAPNDPKYAEILEHIGGLKPGETKPVKPWPDK